MQHESSTVDRNFMIPHTAKVLMFNDNVLQTEIHENRHIRTEPVLLHI